MLDVKLDADFIWIFVVFGGLIFGSFANAVVYRLPRQMIASWREEAASILKVDNFSPDSSDLSWSLFSRSKCPNCLHVISWWQNVPVLSYFYLKGRCFFCGKPISARYPLVELLVAALFSTVFFHFGLSWRFLCAAIFSFYLLVAALIDFDTQLLPDEITWPLLMMGLLFNSFEIFVPMRDAVWGAIFGYYCLWVIYWFFFWLTKKHGFGFGDFKLMCAMGAWLGWKAIPMIIMGSCLEALSVSFVCFVLSYKPGYSQTDGSFLHWQIPFGPYLSFMGWVAMLFADKQYFYSYFLPVH